MTVIKTWGVTRSSLLGFRHKRVVTVREFYTECNAGFRWSEELFYPTLAGHIHLDKYLISNSFSLRLLWRKVYSFNKQLIIVYFHFGYFI
jgi:hypothetical protein